MIPGHLYGPPAPMIAFWHGANLIGAALGSPRNIESAREKVRGQIQILEPGPNGLAKIHALLSARVMLYCGPIKVEML